MDWLILVIFACFCLYKQDDYLLKMGFLDVTITKTKLHLQRKSNRCLSHKSNTSTFHDSLIHYRQLNCSLHQCKSNQTLDVHRGSTLIVTIHVIFLAF